jgi:sugar/nucleoside kinase (ribokinase family)
MAAPRWDVVGIGESSVDEVYRLPTAPGPNLKLPVSSREIRYGGQVATTLAACASFGLRSAYAGVLGGDANGDGVRDALHRRGVDTSAAIRRASVAQRRALILVDERTGDRSVLWERDPRLALDASEVPASSIASARLLHLDTVDEDATLAAADLARSARIPVTSDIDRVTDRTMAIVAAITVPIFAEHVPAALTGEADAERALRALRRTHAGMLCVTLGARGAMLLAGNHLHVVRAPAVNAVDATGAGDIFRGAFIYALLRGDTPFEILRFANAAAALGCTREGAIDSVPTLKEVEALLRSPSVSP